MRAPIFSVLTLAALSALASSSTARPTHETPTEVARRYLATCEARGWSGTVLVEQRGKLVLHEGFGLADRARSTPCGVATRYEIASATKPFTACAILRLVEDGKLTLETPIGKLLPGIPEERAAITVEQLLAHTSGMPRDAASGSGADLELAVKAYFSTPAVREPGASHEYWNGGYALLAGIVETVAGEPYTDYCRRTLFAPAGLTATGFTGDSLPLDMQAVGYGARKNRRAAEHAYQGSYGWHYRGMGGIVTTAADLAAFMHALESGKILPRKTVADMWTVRDGHYGLGFGIATNTPRGGRRVGHGGDVDGFHTSFQHFPDDELTIVVLTNSELVPAWKTGWDLEAIFFGGAPRNVVLPALEPLGKKLTAELTGAYKTADGAEFRVEASGEYGLVIEARDSLASAMLDGRSSTVGEQAGAALLPTLLGYLDQRDTSALGDVLHADVPTTWAARLVDHVWPNHLADVGAFVRCDVRSTNERDGASVEIWADLHHNNGVAPLYAVLLGGRLRGFDLHPAGIPPETRRYLIPKSEARFEDAPLSSASSTVSLTPEHKRRKLASLELRVTGRPAITLIPAP